MGSVLESQNPKCQDLPKFQFGEGGSGTKFKFRGKLSNLVKISWSLACLCITESFSHSLSHTTYVETNKQALEPGTVDLHEWQSHCCSLCYLDLIIPYLVSIPGSSVHVICKTALYFQTSGRERLIRSHSSARFCFELSGNLN